MNYTLLSRKLISVISVCFILSSCNIGKIKPLNPPSNVIREAIAPDVSVNQAIFETVGTCSFRPISEPTHAAAFSYRVSFSEAISASTFTVADITNSGTGGGGSLTWTLSNCGDNKNFKLTASSIVGDGTIIPSIDMDEVQDLAGNLNFASTATDNSIDYSAPTGWIQEAYIKASNNGANDLFGTSVSVSGDTLVVGTPYESSNEITITNGSGAASTDNSNPNSGAVYVYKRSGVTWAQEAYIKASNNGAGDYFGYSVSVSGDTLVVGAYLEDSNETTITGSGAASTDNSNPNSGAVYVYKRSGVTWAQEAYIKASNNGAGDQFGYSVSVSGDTLVVGVSTEDSNETTITNGSGSASADNSNTDSGAVYVYKRSGVTWAQEAYIKASNNGASDLFGTSVSVSGDTLVVGTPYESSNEITITNGSGAASTDNSNPNSGAVYVYKRSGVTWTQEAYIKASNNGAGDYFGYSVSVSGDTLVVGASEEDSNQTTITNGSGSASADNSNSESGAVYVYKRSGVTWAQEAYIKASNNGASDLFGTSVSVSGDTLVVGTPYESSNEITITNGSGAASTDNSNPNSGAVYVYKRSGVTWAQEAYIKASNNGAGDYFGYSVSVSGDTLVVGASEEDSNQTTITNGSGAASADNSNLSSGAVYVYRNDARLFSPVDVYSSATTTSLSLKWSTAGALTLGYKIAYSAGLTPPADCNSGTVVDVGNVLNYDFSLLSVATRYSFRLCSYDSLDNLSEGYTATFATAPSTPEVSDLAVSGITKSNITLSWTSGGGATTGFKVAYLAGAGPLTDCTGGTVIDAGNVSSYELTGLALATTYVLRVCSYNSSGVLSLGREIIASTHELGWVQEAYIKASNNEAYDTFGSSVSVSGDTLVVGAYEEDSNQTTITGSGAASADNSNLSSGAVYVYKRSGATWAQEAYIKASNNGTSDWFGSSVSVSGDTLVVGAIYEDSNQTTITGSGAPGGIDLNLNSGAVYVYKRSGVTWAQEAYIKASNNGIGDNFGSSVSVSGDTLVVGVHYEDSNQTTITGSGAASGNNSNPDSGAVYVYKRSGVTWAQEAYVKASNNGAGDFFGYSVSVSGDTLVVGAHGEDSNQTTITGSGAASANNSNSDSGAVYVYKRSGVTWAQEAYIKASNNGADDYFGRSVSISGDTLVVGADGEDSNQTTITGSGAASADNSNSYSGATYVYKRSGVTWAQEAYIKASNNEANDQFGSSVSVSGDTLVVGAYGESSNQTTITNGSGTASADNSNSYSGAAYVYKRSGVTWAQEAYIKASNNETFDTFGSRVSVSGDTLVVGVYGESSNQTTITNGSGVASLDNSNFGSGAVYVYRNIDRLFEVPEAWTTATNSSITLTWLKSGGTATSYFYAYLVGTTAPALCDAGMYVDAGDTTTDTVPAVLLPATTYSFRLCAYQDGSTISSGIVFSQTTLP